MNLHEYIKRECPTVGMTPTIGPKTNPPRPGSLDYRKVPSLMSLPPEQRPVPLSTKDKSLSPGEKYARRI